MATCLVCGSSNVTVYLDDADDDLEISKMGSSRTQISPGTILRCRECSFAFRKNRFNDKRLANLYRKMDPEVYQAEQRGRTRTATTHLRIVSRYAGRNGKRGELLDVGCASGIFLGQALDASWGVTGLEPSEILYKQATERIGARGTILPLILEQADFGTRRFDVITLWDVLEHVTNPAEFLKRCRALLRPEGYLLLNVPHFDSLEARLLGRRWPLLLPEHLNYFNRKSLQLCAKNCGLDLIRFGRRCSFFSVQYVLLRLSQHQIPLAGVLSGIAQTAVGRIVVPVSLGETYAVFRNS